MMRPHLARHTRNEEHFKEPNKPEPEPQEPLARGKEKARTMRVNISEPFI